jgi:amidase
MARLKPTVGLVSRRGIVPISQSQDTAGPMARSVADVAALLSVLAARDPEGDPDTRAERRGPALVPGDYTRWLQADGLRGLRVGVVVPEQLGVLSPAAAAAATSAVRHMEAAGAVVVPVPALAGTSGGPAAALHKTRPGSKEGHEKLISEGEFSPGR